MNWDTASKILAAVLPAAAALLQIYSARGHGRRRAQLDADVTLLNALPEDSASRPAWLKHVDEQVQRTIFEHNELTRNTTGVVLALVFLIVAAGSAYFLYQSPGSWWLWILILFFGTFSLVGLSQDAVRRKRDDKGRAIRT